MGIRNYPASKALYQPGYKFVYSDTPIVTGTAAKSGIGYSKHRPAPVGTTEPVKYSMLLAALAELIKAEPKVIYSMAGSKVVYIEIFKHSFLASCGRIKHEPGKAPNDIEMIFCSLAAELECGDNEELKSLYKSAMTECKKRGKIAAYILAALCDSYFYGCVKAAHGTYCLEDTLVLAEVEQAFRNGYFRKCRNACGLGGIAEPENVALPKKREAPSKKETAAREKPDAEKFMTDCKAGAYKIAYKWDASQEERIQKASYLDSYIPDEDFIKIVRKIKKRTDRVLERIASDPGLTDRPAIIGDDYINLTLVGKPGTGKTALVYAVSAATGLPVYTTSCSQNTEEEEFEGKTKIVDGKPASVFTDALTCFENGGIFLLEEANLTPPAVIMGALGQAVEYPFILKKFGYETIRRHPLCIFVSTMNTGTAGSKVMSQPFANRFKQSYVMNDPGREQFVQILMKRTGETEEICRWVYSVYDKITGHIANNCPMADFESILMSLSLRSCIGAIENIQDGADPKEAVEDSIIGKIYEQDSEVAKSCRAILDAIA